MFPPGLFKFLFSLRNYHIVRLVHPDKDSDKLRLNDNVVLMTVIFLYTFFVSKISHNHFDRDNSTNIETLFETKKFIYMGNKKTDSFLVYGILIQDVRLLNQLPLYSCFPSKIPYTKW